MFFIIIDFIINNINININNDKINDNEKQINNFTFDDKKEKVIAISREKTISEKGKRKRKSLFLNPDLRAATLLEISNTSKVRKEYTVYVILFLF